MNTVSERRSKPGIEDVVMCVRGCGAVVFKGEEAQHECPLEVLSCSFARSGCPARITRRDEFRHKEENVQQHLDLLNNAAIERDERMAKLEKALHVREMELNDLHKLLDKERAERQEMFDAYDSKMQQLLELFQNKIKQNSMECVKASKQAALAHNRMEDMRRTVDQLIFDMKEMQKEAHELSSAVRLASFTAEDEPRPSTLSSLSEITSTLYVSKSDRYQRISDALEAAKSGDKIIVRAGKYKETLRLSRPVILVGEGHVDDIVLETNGRDALIAETEFGSISNITIRQRGSGFWNCIDIMAGKLLVEGCKLSSASLTCVSVHHKDTKPKIHRCTILQCAGTGIHFYDGSAGVVEDSEIHHNGQSGIEISEGSRPEIRFNRIRSNGKHGIAVFDNGRGLITDNDINSNGLAGIDVRESSNPRIVRNKIFGHEHSGGVDVHHHSRCEVEKNDIFQNSLSGITCWQAGKPLCKQNRITQNGEFGILVKDGGWGTFEHNDLRGNSRGSLFVSEESKNKVILDNNSVE